MEERREEEQVAPSSEGAAVAEDSETSEEVIVDATGMEEEAAEAEGEPPAEGEESLREAVARLESELTEARAQAAESLDRMQRTAAEFQNARKRQERHLRDSIDRATEGLVRQLLPVLDDCELAFKNVPASLDDEEAAWVDGFARVHQKLSNILTEAGLSAIAEEGPFDPNRHEAVTNEPNDDVESGHIIETLRTGYEYKERVLRPALVRVAQ